MFKKKIGVFALCVTMCIVSATTVSADIRGNNAGIMNLVYMPNSSGDGSLQTVGLWDIITSQTNSVLEAISSRFGIPYTYLISATKRVILAFRAYGWGTSDYVLSQALGWEIGRYYNAKDGYPDPGPFNVPNEYAGMFRWRGYVVKGMYVISRYF